MTIQPRSRQNRARNRAQHAVVTGATSGIGLEVSILLLARGYHVTAIGSRREISAQLRQAAPAARLRYISTDLSSPEEIDRLSVSLARQVPRVRLLVHSAGVFLDDGTCLADRDASRRQLSVNFEAPVRLTERLTASLRRDAGTVAFLGSSAAAEPSPVNGMYAASKAALQCYAKALRRRLNPQGVRVAWLAIGRTHTAMQTNIARKEGRPIPARYLISPVTLAQLIVFLCELPKDIEVTDVAARPMRKRP